MIKRIKLIHVYGAILTLAIALIANACYMQSKAWLAQVLINQSWQESMAKGERIRPWPWSDTWPVSRLIMPQHQVDLILLAGDDGRTLAFGPGVRLSAALPGQAGVSMISAHRDTYFEFLENVKIGESFTIQNTQGKYLRYRITATEIIDQPVLHTPLSTKTPQIVFVTCYPFHALTSGGPQRYIVYAELEKSTLI